MINLLPPSRKEDIYYARRNKRLIGWVTGLGASILLTAAIIIAGGIYLDRSINQHADQVKVAREQLDEQKVEDTRKRAEEMSNSLKLATQVLGKQVLFSKLLQQIGAAMPENSALTGLSINKLEGGIDLRAGATDYNAATQVQVNLSDPANQIFNKADIVSITCGSSNDPRYDCDIVIRAEFAKDNPFLLINAGATP